jgi:hypothetical protein
MKSKIVSFGDSFVFGSELSNNFDGSKSWIGLCANQLGVAYQTLAVPGCGNEAIARQIYTYFSENSKNDCLAVINWTWVERWDFYISKINEELIEDWITLGPTCVPSKLERIMPHANATRLIDFYCDYAGNSVLWDRWRTLQTMYSVQSYLASEGIENIQTCIDYSVFDQEFHCPAYVKLLQNKIKSNIESFNGMGFLEWSRYHGFKITENWWHPLEDAHVAATEMWLDRYRDALKK